MEILTWINQAAVRLIVHGRDSKPTPMTDKYKDILDAMMAEGFHEITDHTKKGYDFDFKITPYSLNTKLSFRFDNLDHFVEFLKRADAYNDKRAEVLNTTFIELGINTSDFFYVNFYTAGKDLEM